MMQFQPSISEKNIHDLYDRKMEKERKPVHYCGFYLIFGLISTIETVTLARKSARARDACTI
jgi:hypothetical protein